MSLPLNLRRFVRSLFRPVPKRRPASRRLQLGGLEERVVPALVPVGDEFRVNTVTVDNQRDQVVAMDADGDFVVVWSTWVDGLAYEIHGQRYNAEGLPQGAGFPVNTTTVSSQLLPAVAMDAAGNFVIAWHSYDQDGDEGGIFARRFNAAGEPLSGEFQVNTYTTNGQYNPAIAMNPAGAFVIAWQSTGQDGSILGIYAQPFTADGQPVGAEIPVNQTTENAQDYAHVAMDAAGNFVVTWDGEDELRQYYDVFARRYNAAGQPSGDEFRVNTTTAGDQAASEVAMDADGDFIVTWASDGPDDSDGGAYAQRYDAAGVPQEVEFRVNTFTAGGQAPGGVAMYPAGGIVFTLISSDPDGSDGVHAQEYRSDGTPLGSEFQVNTFTQDQQWFPDVAVSADGDAVIVWNSWDQDGNFDGVYAQRYKENQPPVISGVPSAGTVDELSAFGFTATATDPDDDPATLRFSLVGAPAGAAIDPITGAFSWTPTEAQGPNTYPFSVRVSDGFNATDAPITLTVREVNTAPTLGGVPASATIDELAAHTFTATATDSDLPAQALTFSLVGAPAGAGIDPATGAFSWTPTEAQGPGAFSFSVRVSDGTASVDAPITLTVREVNTAPTLTVPAAATAVPGATLTLTATATDPDLIGGVPNPLTFSLEGAPAGAAIDPATGAISWTPGSEVIVAVYGLQVRVTDGASPPGTDTETVRVIMLRAAILDGDLVVGGTGANDVIAVVPAGDPAKLAFRFNGAPAGEFSRDAITGRIVVHGLDGNDKLTVGPTVAIGADLWGGAGNDTLTGGAGADVLRGEAGNDRLVGGRENDRYLFTDLWGVDTVVETSTGGTDTVDFAAATGALTFTVAASVRATAGTNRAAGGYLENLLGGSGDDTFKFPAGGKVRGTVDGGPGVNTLNYAAYLTPVTVNLGLGTATGTAGIAGITNVTGGAAGDTLVGNAAANALTGNGGRDLLIGAGGADALVGGGGDDLLIGGSTAHDGTPTALAAVRKEWVRAATYPTRIGHLLGTIPGGLNGTLLLDAAGLSDDAGAADALTGGLGKDWFLTFAGDTTDAVAGETVTAH